MNEPITTDDPLISELSRLRRRVAELERQAALKSSIAERNPTNLAVLLENTTDAIWSIDTGQRLVFFNSCFAVRFAAVFGDAPAVGLTPAELLPPGTRETWEGLNSRVLAGECFSVEQQFEIDGDLRVFDVSLHPIWLDGQVTGAALFSRDVTEYKRSQENLLRQSSILQSMVDNIGDGVVVADEHGRFLLFNPAAERIMRLGMTDTPSHEWTQRYGLFLPDGVTPYPADQLPLVRAIGGEVVDDCTIFVRHENLPNGAWISVNTRPLIDKTGVPRGGVAVFRDITETKRIAEVRDAEQQFMQQLLMAHERDRQLMAYEIHDGLVQDITAALMHLESVWPQQAPGREGGSFGLALKLLRESLDEGRRLISGLRPPILDEMGIVAAIDYLVGEHVAEGVSAIRFNHDVYFDRLEPLLEGTLFRIAQEALTNIRRHSEALTASVDFSQIGDRIQLQVRDWGVGFDTSQIDKRRFGLRGIRERARLLGGRAEIESKLGHGTRVFVELPISPAHQMAGKRSAE